METFYFILAHLWAINSVENKIDKKGKPFKSFRFSKEDQKHHFWVKTLVLYEDTQKGIVKILLNAGAIRYEDDREFPISKSYTFKNSSYGLHAVYSRNKWLGSVSSADIEKLISLTEAPIRAFAEDLEGMF